MTDAMNVENVNVAEILEQEESKAKVQALLADFEGNPAALKVLEAVETAVDAYEIVKNFAKIKLEEFKVLFDKTVKYFKEDKAKLDDEALEQVSGGSFASWWQECKKAVICSTIVLGCLLGGAIAGACVGGLYGLVVGATIGGAAALTLAVPANAAISDGKDGGGSGSW